MLYLRTRLDVAEVYALVGTKAMAHGIEHVGDHREADERVDVRLEQIIVGMDVCSDPFYHRLHLVPEIEIGVRRAQREFGTDGVALVRKAAAAES